MRQPQLVVIHRVGPNWQPWIPVFEQPGLQGHVDHYRALLLEGKLAMGGPFLDEQGGGMMLAAPGVTRDELTAFAAQDPTVASGLLEFTIRPWLIAMSASAAK